MVLPVDFHYKSCFRKPLTAPTKFKVGETCACRYDLYDFLSQLPFYVVQWQAGTHF
jgi:hypothetical protein